MPEDDLVKNILTQQDFAIVAGSTKKKEAIQVTQVLIPNKLKTQKTANESEFV